MAKTAKGSTARVTRPAGVKGRFNPEAFLASAGVARKVTQYEKGDPVFSQGDACRHVHYIQKGA